MLRLLRFITLLTVLSGAGTLANADVEAGKAIAIRDDLGREVRLDGVATRVAAASPAAVDVLLSIGVRPVTRPWLPGRTPDSWEGIPTIGLDHASGPNLEQLVAARPDLIVVDVTSARFVDRIERLVGAPVYCLQVSDIEGLPDRLRELGVLSGHETEADEQALRTQSVIDTLRDEHRSGSPTRVVALFGGPRTGYAFTPESYVASLLELVGAEMVLAGGEPHGMFPELSRYSAEQVWASDPDAIVILSHGAVHNRLPQLQADPVWSGLRAVREGRVQTLSDDLFVMRPGADFLDAIAALRAALDPQD